MNRRRISAAKRRKNSPQRKLWVWMEKKIQPQRKTTFSLASMLREIGGISRNGPNANC
jgi:hypothetical protein